MPDNDPNRSNENEMDVDDDTQRDGLRRTDQGDDDSERRNTGSGDQGGQQTGDRVGQPGQDNY
ncbi:MAG TPA: hypothetical protein VGS22_27190 [Thermoanaerobaculia bacterium]|jgi:hypothetical protein|nr:hypothetical protein [Thermoanaerobaculia bacterium]